MVARNGMLVGLFAFAAWGQTSDKVFYFTHLETPQAMQEVSNAVRSIGDIRDVSLDAAERSLTVKGTADQIAIAGWLTAELDKSGTAPGTHDFPLNDPTTPVAADHLSEPRGQRAGLAGDRQLGALGHGHSTLLPHEPAEGDCDARVTGAGEGS